MQAWNFSRRGKRKKEKGEKREREFTIGVTNGVALPILLMRTSLRFIPAPTIIGTATVCRRLIKRDWYTREVCVTSKRNCRRRRRGMKITKGREMCGGIYLWLCFFRSSWLRFRDCKIENRDCKIKNNMAWAKRWTAGYWL